MITTGSEWRHIVRVADITAPQRETFNADAATCAALATRMALPAVESVAVDVKIIPQSGRFHVLGELKSTLTYVCIRTGQDFKAEVIGPVDGWYMDKEGAVSFAKARKKRAEDEGDQPNFVDEVDDPEPLENGGIDLGELAAQSLSLALDPFPVSPDAPPPVDDSAEPVKIDNPFAVLGQLRSFMTDDK